MSSESTREELLSVVRTIREHALYLQELGVEHNEEPPAFQSVNRAGPANEIAASALAAITPPITTTKTRQSPTTGMVPAQTPPPAALNSEAFVRSPLIENLFGELLPKQDDRLPESNETFQQIWNDVGVCTRCPLSEGRTNIVHTDGNKQARLMFVGEAPGADEDAQARPFVGRAGQLLTKIIEAIGLKRQEVLIGNVNRCRPPGNRPPTPDEVSMCKPFLLREIAVARPEVIVVLGNTAMKNLLGTKEGITRVRGQFQNYKGVKVMPTFHPAYLLRDPSKKRETWEDLKRVRDYLDSTATK